jgi:hypothetical protein
MAIDFEDAIPGMNVFYQQPHMRHPEYGRISSTNLDELPRLCNQIVRVLFLGDETAKPCHPEDLHWPPNFCAKDGANPPGQKFSNEWPGYSRTLADRETAMIKAEIEKVKRRYNA